MIDRIRQAAHRLPRPVRRRLRRTIGDVVDRRRRRRRPRWGNLRRTEPFSTRYGFDRGTPIDRWYLHRFFAAHASELTGRVLEVKDPTFTHRHGRDWSSVDLLDIDPGNAAATVVADLSEGGSLPTATWDCIVVPQTLQYVDDPASAVSNAWQALRPGGVLLVTVPTVARRDPGLQAHDRWRFLPAGLADLLDRGCPGGEVQVESFGNLLVTQAFLLGLAAEELEEHELLRHDARFPLLVCGRARRRSGP